MKTDSKTIILLIILMSLLLHACRCPSCSREEETLVPKDLLSKANEFIKQRTGNEFFDKYISPDFVRTKFTPPYYFLTYRLIIPDKPYVNTVIQFSVDSLGNVVKDRDIIGIPNCIEEGCNFKITEDDAIKIAIDNGLKKGIKPWKRGFIWDAKLKQYTWHILSTESELQSSEGFRGFGKEIIIDPNSGLVLAMNDWHVN
ncbi:MAG: hypothetical protein P4L27_11360 [Ignavibacteriaceae bacterium]|nr:hypothetical protein [Ignavibacteriaceae bacterium]